MRPPGAPSPTGNTIYGASKACKNFRGQRLLGAEIQSPEKSPVGWVNMRAYNFLVSGPKFTHFFRPIGDEMQLIMYYSDLRQFDVFLRHSRSKSKVVKNRAEFWTFLPSQILQGHPLQNQCPLDHPGLVPRHLVKFREGRPTTPKVIGAHVWNFKPNFKCSFLKFLGGSPTVFVVCVSKA